MHIRPTGGTSIRKKSQAGATTRGPIARCMAIEPDALLLDDLSLRWTQSAAADGRSSFRETLTTYNAW